MKRLTLLTLLLINTQNAYTLPQAFSEHAFDVTTNAALDIAHETATHLSIEAQGTDPAADLEPLDAGVKLAEEPAPTPAAEAEPKGDILLGENGGITPIAAASATGAVAAEAHPVEPAPLSVQSHSSDAASWKVSDNYVAPSAHPTPKAHFDEPGLEELLDVDSAVKLTGDGGDSDTSTSETEVEFLSSPKPDPEAGIVPVYMAGKYLVAEVNIGNQWVLLKLDTGSFHFWVISDEAPELCNQALHAGSGCYTASPTCTEEGLPTVAPYSYSYPDGTRVRGTKVSKDSVNAPAILGAAVWSNQIIAMPASITGWDGESGMSGVFPMGYDSKAYQASKGITPEDGVTTLDEVPLDVTDWHYFTTYLKPGTQMFLGFDHDPTDLYDGPLNELAVVAVNGSWAVMPDSGWTSLVAMSDGSGDGTTTTAADAGATETPVAPEDTPVATDSPVESTPAAETPTTITESTSEIPTTTETTTSSTDTTTTITTPPAEGSVENSDSNAQSLAESILAGISASLTEFNIPSAAPAALAQPQSTDEGDVMKRSVTQEALPAQQKPQTHLKRKLKHKRQSQDTPADVSTEATKPILLDTGSKETLLDLDSVVKIYAAISGSCITTGGTLHNCTFPCVTDYATFTVKPEYPAAIGLPWGGTTIPVDLAQFATEVYSVCKPKAGETKCESTCRGAIQAQEPDVGYHVYGILVYRSAFFKWDTAGNGTVGMAPYAGTAGESWFYE